MARLTTPRKGLKPGTIDIRPVNKDNLNGARPLLTLLSLADGQVATWPFTENLVGLDTEDVARLCEAVRISLMRLVRPQG